MITGSIVAFMKLAGKMTSKPMILPGRHLINSLLMGTNIAGLGAFVTMAPAAPMIGAALLCGNALLSFIKVCDVDLECLRRAELMMVL